jgi:hypothetical protein
VRACPGFTRLVAFCPTLLPSSRMEVTSWSPITWTEAARVPVLPLGVEESQFLKLILRQLPALARRTSGRGRFPSRSRWLLHDGVPPVLETRSRSSTYIICPGSWAPSRLYHTNCSIATTFATKVREHVGCTATASSLSSTSAVATGTEVLISCAASPLVASRSAATATPARTGLSRPGPRTPSRLM